MRDKTPSFYFLFHRKWVPKPLYLPGCYEWQWLPQWEWRWWGLKTGHKSGDSFREVMNSYGQSCKHAHSYQSGILVPLFGHVLHAFDFMGIFLGRYQAVNKANDQNSHKKSKHAEPGSFLFSQTGNQCRRALGRISKKET